jgi:hypothetical protein
MTNITACGTRLAEEHRQESDSVPSKSDLSHIQCFRRFDVRRLISRGIEPFPVIHERAERLKPYEGLLLVAPLLPTTFISSLSKRGFQCRTEHGFGGAWFVWLWRTR